MNPMENERIQYLLKNRGIDHINSRDVHFITCELMREDKDYKPAPHLRIKLIQIMSELIWQKIKIMELGNILKN